MSVAQITLTILGLLGLGTLLPKLGKVILDFFRGNTQAEVSLKLIEKETQRNSIERVERQATELFDELMRIKADYTRIAIAKGIAEYELAQCLKREAEKDKLIEELEKRS